MAATKKGRATRAVRGMARSMMDHQEPHPEPGPDMPEMDDDSMPMPGKARPSAPKKAPGGKRKSGK